MRALCIFALLHCATALNNGLAITPPMGWLSWAQFACNINCVTSPLSCISENLYMDMADRLVSDGYLDVGYQYVNIDDCWMSAQRDPDGTLQADATRFPHGMKWLAKYMHDRGLKLGIYQDFGTKTCVGYPGIFGHLETDAKTLASWDIDSLKLDGCNVNVSLMDEGYPEFGKYLNKTGRPILYACSWPADQMFANVTPNLDRIKDVCNQYRNWWDISASWDRISFIIDWYDHHQDWLIPVHGPGHWNDPDMIVVGQSTISVDQARAQFSIWSIWSAPLLMSNDLRFISPVHKEILMNRLVIAVDQDPMGVMGRLWANDSVHNVAAYVKPVIPVDPITQQASIAVVLLNRNLDKKANIVFKLSDLNMTNSDGYTVENLWTYESYGILLPTDHLSFLVNPTAAVMLKSTVISRKNLQN